MILKLFFWIEELINQPYRGKWSTKNFLEDSPLAFPAGDHNIIEQGVHEGQVKWGEIDEGSDSEEKDTSNQLRSQHKCYPSPGHLHVIKLIQLVLFRPSLSPSPAQPWQRLHGSFGSAYNIQKLKPSHQAKAFTYWNLKHNCTVFLIFYIHLFSFVAYHM